MSIGLPGYEAAIAITVFATGTGGVVCLSSSPEEQTVDKGKGRIPSWLSGSLYRNGGGIFKMGDTRYRHMFDGLAVLHRWSITDGKVTYLSSILDTDSYKKCVKADRLVGDGVGTSFPDPCRTIFNNFFSYFLPMDGFDNCAVNVVEHGDRLFALTESSLIHEVDGSTLLSQGKVNINKFVAVHLGTAHPHFGRDKSMYYYATSPATSHRAYNIVKVPPPEKGEDLFSKAKIVASIPSRWHLNVGYTHSFGMSENYFIYFELPVATNVPRVLTMKLWSGTIEDCMLNFPDEPIRIHVVRRDTGERLPIQFLAPHGFVFHFINCYEDSGFLICDVCLFNSGSEVKQMYIDNVLEKLEKKIPGDSQFARFVLPLSLDKAKAGENLITLPNVKATAVLRPGTKNTVDVTHHVMFDKSYAFELPRINYDRNALNYRFVYASTVLRKHCPRLLKFDVQTLEVKEWRCEPNHMAGEPVFVKNPSGVEEDDGVILCPVLAETTNESSYLIVLDAGSFKELGRATVPAHLKMSLTFHGDFYNR
ncbi:retinoid isomerohydrolase [Aplysia californica]|uniref:Retinoid isomerohydrolase n=1 Tax=Aplysia californica TaxID=6500 RepID=A0ABM1W3E2_APLCA|nr:retinoid isomerohydrolase [Aplysia californica]